MPRPQRNLSEEQRHGSLAMMKKTFINDPLRGIAQVNISADDVRKARDWYAVFLGGDPYFQRPDADNPAYLQTLESGVT